MNSNAPVVTTSPSVGCKYFGNIKCLLHMISLIGQGLQTDRGKTSACCNMFVYTFL